MAGLLAPAAAAAVEELPAAEHPWKETEVAYGLCFHPLADEKAERARSLPIWGHRLTLLPRVRLASWVEVSARLAFEQVLGASSGLKGFTTVRRDHDLHLTDLLVGLSSAGITEPLSGVRLSGGLHFLAPTSEGSQAEELYGAPGAAAELSRDLPLLGGLTLGYLGRFSYTLHRYTTVTGRCPSGIMGDCNTGVRTTWAGLAHGPWIRFHPTPRISLEASLLLLTAFVHGLAGVPDAPLETRTTTAYRVSLGYRLYEYLTVRAGVANLASKPLPECGSAPALSSLSPQVFLELGFFFDPLL